MLPFDEGRGTPSPVFDRHRFRTEFCSLLFSISKRLLSPRVSYILLAGVEVKIYQWHQLTSLLHSREVNPDLSVQLA